MNSNPLRLCFLPALLLFSVAALGQGEFKVAKHKLKNGLTVLLLEDRTFPTVAYHTLFKVGARNERPGITGLSHLFEHMMFNGSEKYKPKQLDQIVEAAGGGANAFTNSDTTEYMQEISSAHLDKIIDLEADRMRALTITKANLDQEREIVKEERRSGLEDNVEASMSELLWNHAFVAHPYRWETIGFMADLNAIRLEDAREYFKTYYAPNNAVLVLVGDFETKAVLKKIEAAYGRIPAQEPPRPVVNAEPVQQGEVRKIYEREAELPATLIGYKGVSVKHADDAVLDVLSMILSGGESSRLYQELIYRQQIAAEVSARNESRLDPGLFTFYVQVQDRNTTGQAEEAIWQVLERIRTGGVTGRELEKAKNGLRVSLMSGFKTNEGIAQNLAHFEGFYGDWRKMYELTKRRDAVTAADIARVVDRYFRADRRTVVELRLKVSK